MGRGLLVVAGVGLAYLVILWLSSFQTCAESRQEAAEAVRAALFNARKPQWGEGERS